MKNKIHKFLYQQNKGKKRSVTRIKTINSVEFCEKRNNNLKFQILVPFVSFFDNIFVTSYKALYHFLSYLLTDAFVKKNKEIDPG